MLLKQTVKGETYYGPPGGRIESDDLEQELQREIFEETGLRITNATYIGDWYFNRNPEHRTTCKTFVAQMTSDSKPHCYNCEDHENIHEFIWVNPQDLITSSHPINPTFLELITQHYQTTS